MYVSVVGVRPQRAKDPEGVKDMLYVLVSTSLSAVGPQWLMWTVIACITCPECTLYDFERVRVSLTSFYLLRRRPGIDG